MKAASVPQGAYTLPYWIEKGPDDGSLWFNEHEGNKIARFDPLNNTLYEYWIPTQDRSWGDCASNSKTCGIANALQFSVGENGQTWFTEWSENKIGRIISPITIKNNNQQPPFSVSASPQELTLRRGQSVEVKLDISTTKVSASALSPSNANIDMVASGTFTPTGELGNSTGSLVNNLFH